MSLRLQLLAFGLLTLLLPWAGLKFVEEVEALLRSSLENELLAVARTVARDIEAAEDVGQRRAAPAAAAGTLYAQTLIGQPPRIEGFRSDWRYRHDRPGSQDTDRSVEFADGSRLWLGVLDQFLYLYMEVRDDQIVVQREPGQSPHGDRIALLMGVIPRSPVARLLVSVAGPDTISSQISPGAPAFVSTGEFDDNIPYSWRRTDSGYAIEARMTLNRVGDFLGIGIIDTDAVGRLAASTWGDTATPGPLVRERPELAPLLRPYEGGKDRFRILDPDGWVLADSGPIEAAELTGEAVEPSLVERFFRYVLRREDDNHAGLQSRGGRVVHPALLGAVDGEPVTVWFSGDSEARAVIAAAVPIEHTGRRIGALLLEQAGDPVLTLTNPATRRLMTATVLVSLVAAVALLAYASVLPFRVRRLARAAETALGPRGEIKSSLPGNRARDEIGDLSRSFQNLLGRLRDYTDYLQSLKSKLSHELRTPLAIVATSVDNLEHETHSESGREYLARLRHGAERLESILQAMTAATRVEQAITQTSLERFDLGAVVAACVSAYGDVYPEQAFAASLPPDPVFVDGSPELIEQMLDKLIDNAVGFAEAGSTIDVSLETDKTEAVLAVVNRGPRLPEAMRHQLFDSLVSVRESDTGRTHLGLGLYIVTLIAEFHRGRVAADNLDDGSGVKISVVLPRADSRSA